MALDGLQGTVLEHADRIRRENEEDKEDKGDFAGRTKGMIRGRTMFSGRAWDRKKRRVLWFARTVESADILGDVGRSIQSKTLGNTRMKVRSTAFTRLLSGREMHHGG